MFRAINITTMQFTQRMAVVINGESVSKGNKNKDHNTAQDKGEGKEG